MLINRKGGKTTGSKTDRVSGANRGTGAVMVVSDDMYNDFVILFSE